VESRGAQGIFMDFGQAWPSTLVKKTDGGFL
jgi:hypothetical protein